MTGLKFKLVTILTLILTLILTTRKMSKSDRSTTLPLGNLNMVPLRVTKEFCLKDSVKKETTLS